MIIFKIKDLLEKNKMTRYKLLQYTDFTIERINDYYFGRVQFIKASDLETFCRLFKCKVEDIIEFKE